MPPRRRAVHGARLDPTGYLRHDPDDAPVVASTWIGEPTGEGVVVDFTDDAAGVNVKVQFTTICCSMVRTSSLSATSSF